MTRDAIGRLALGGAFIQAQREEQCVATVRRALELGIRYIDTSPMYSQGRSQNIIGQALRGADASTITLATKLGYLETRVQHRSIDALRAQLADNLRRLEREAVDVLQVHEADLAQWWTDDPLDTGRIKPEKQYDFRSAPVMQVLRDARDRGLCRRIGITGNVAAPMTRLLRELDVDSFLLAFNYDLLHRDALREAIPLAKAKGVAMLVGGIFHCGQLATVHREWLDAPPDWMKPDVREQYARLYDLQAASGLSLVELAIRYLLSDERLDQIILGVASPDEIEHAVHAAARGPLPPDLHDRVEQLCPA